MPKRWEVSFASSDKLRTQERARHGMPPEAEETGDPCTRDVRCAGRRIVVEGTERKVVPARSYGPFCPACEGLIGRCLSELPPAYVRLGEEIPEMHRRGAGGHSAFGPRLPFDATYDALQRAIADVLASWCERVRTTARLSVLDTELSRRRDQAKAVTEYAQLLTVHLSVLIALPAEPMMRSVPDAGHYAPDVIRLEDLTGADAGLEILDLHRRALLILGEIVPRRETLDGVPCKRCEHTALVRAEPPSDPSREAMWSECTQCGNQMSQKDFLPWAKWYATWADRMGLACERCKTGDTETDPVKAAWWHSQCIYASCNCLVCHGAEDVPAA